MASNELSALKNGMARSSLNPHSLEAGDPYYIGDIYARLKIVHTIEQWLRANTQCFQSIRCMPLLLLWLVHAVYLSHKFVYDAGPSLSACRLPTSWVAPDALLLQAAAVTRISSPRNKEWESFGYLLHNIRYRPQIPDFMSHCED